AGPAETGRSISPARLGCPAPDNSGGRPHGRRGDPAPDPYRPTTGRERRPSGSGPWRRGGTEKRAAPPNLAHVTVRPTLLSLASPSVASTCQAPSGRPLRRGSL